MDDITLRAPWPALAARLPISCDEHSDTGTGAHVSVAGELDIATLPELDRELRRAQAGAPLVVLDLHEVEFMACDAVHVLLAADRRARAAGGRLIVVRSHAVERLLELVGIAFPLELVEQAPERLPLPRSWTAVPA